jgi:hypothetical protein
MSEGWTTPDEYRELSIAATAGRSLAFQVRPAPFVIAGRQHGLSASAAQAILKEVNRLPRQSYPSAEETARQIDWTLRDGSRACFTDEQARTLLAAVERIRLRSGRLPTELAPLREDLLSTPLPAA